MKRLLLCLSILAAGTGAFWPLRSGTLRAQRASAARLEALSAQTQTIARTRSQREALEHSVKTSERELASLEASGGGFSPADWFIPKPGQKLSADQSEKLLSQLGLNWNSTGNYVVVTKDTLRALGLDGIKNSKLTQVACQVMGLTPEEQASIDATLQQLNAHYDAWARAHVRREEPSGDVVAKYTLPADPEFFQGLVRASASQIMGTLGTERAFLLLRYSYRWMVDHGLEPYVQPHPCSSAPTTMMVTRTFRNGQVRFSVELKQAGNTSYYDLFPGQAFPEPFQAVFPGGWSELAQREGFALPKGFPGNPPGQNR